MEEKKLKAKYRGRPLRSVQEQEILNDIEELRTKLPEFCTGCGIQLQSTDPDAPGFYQIPKKILEEQLLGEKSQEDNLRKGDDKVYVQYKENEFFQEDEANWEQQLEEQSDQLAALQEFKDVNNGEDDDIVNDSDDEDDQDIEKLDMLFKDGPEERRYKQKMDKLNEMIQNPEQFDASSELGKPQLDIPSDAYEEENIEKEDKLNVELLCARCFSLRHRGCIKSEKAESQLPVFDLGQVVGKKILQLRGRRHVIVCVVDLSDFDGSLPRKSLKRILPKETEVQGPGHKFILVANKLDLLPDNVNRHRVEQWVIRRAKQGGIPRPDSVHLVSALENLGVKTLLIIIRRFLGNAGDLWVVGSQNSGKSTLINTLMKQGIKHKYMEGKKEVTSAALPGTTLGLLQVKDIALPRKCRGFDTPGIVQLHQLSSRLNPDEVRMLIPRRTLKPRTFRICPGYSISIGGIARVDVLASPASTLYMTFWASDEIVCHMGRTSSAEQLLERHGGVTLIPPLGGIERVKQIGELVPTKVYIQGDSFRESSHDIHLAGIGWFGVAVKGRGDFKVWAHPGVAITTREALMPEFARKFEKMGWGNKGIKLKTSLKKKLLATKGTQPWLK